LRQRFAYLKAVGVVGLTLGVLAIGAIVRGLFCTATGGGRSPAPGRWCSSKISIPATPAPLTVDFFVIWGSTHCAVGLPKLADTLLARAAASVLGGGRSWLRVPCWCLTLGHRSWRVQ